MFELFEGDVEFVELGLLNMGMCCCVGYGEVCGELFVELYLEFVGLGKKLLWSVGFFR